MAHTARVKRKKRAVYHNIKDSERRRTEATHDKWLFDSEDEKNKLNINIISSIAIKESVVKCVKGDVRVGGGLETV